MTCGSRCIICKLRVLFQNGGVLNNQIMPGNKQCLKCVIMSGVNVLTDGEGSIICNFGDILLNGVNGLKNTRQWIMSKRIVKLGEDSWVECSNGIC